MDLSENLIGGILRYLRGPCNPQDLIDNQVASTIDKKNGIFFQGNPDTRTIPQIFWSSVVKCGQMPKHVAIIMDGYLTLLLGNQSIINSYTNINL